MVLLREGEAGCVNLACTTEERQNWSNWARQGECKNNLAVTDFPIKKQLVTSSVNLNLPPRCSKDSVTLGPAPPRPPRAGTLRPAFCESNKIHNFLSNGDKESSMSFWKSRRRRALMLALLATIIFIIATSLPFLVDRLRPAPPPGPPHLLFQPPPWPLPRSLPAPRSALSNQVASSPILGELFLTVKTTQRFHYPRLVILLETWGSLVQEQTWYFTDRGNASTDNELEARSQGRLVRTDCPASHHRLSLCCKMEQVRNIFFYELIFLQEFEHFLRSHKQWWCHFDDDNYVNVAALLKLLEK